MISGLEYDLEQIVYLRHDPDKHPRMVTAIINRLCGVTYELSCGSEITEHCLSEIIKDPAFIPGG